MQPGRIGIDSNCLSYLINAASSEARAETATSEEGVALVRIWFYGTERLHVTETVAAECSEIKDPGKKAIHAAFTSQTYWGVPVINAEAVRKRADALKQLHRGSGDRFALAEAEDAELSILLTYDKAFLKLDGLSNSTVCLAKPSDYWRKLNLPRGAKPIVQPAFGNPLEIHRWWVW